MKRSGAHEWLGNLVGQAGFPTENHCPKEARVLVVWNAALQSLARPIIEGAIEGWGAPAFGLANQPPVVRRVRAQDKKDALPFQIALEVEKPGSKRALRARNHSENFDSCAGDKIIG